ncbi:MAG: three-Cys-motif partner protein TcmP [Sedimentisphaerales bacterium]|nr:three-Cys-motif partner protein TcmP [Sedimentisphaerales bacterium]
MADQLPTVWDITPHTLAKHQILTTYLKAWMPIMSHQSHQVGVTGGRLLFVDGFAGPGSYKGGEEGSPILAIKSVLEHSHDFHIPVRFLFIEENAERYKLLIDAVQKQKQQIDSCSKIESYLVNQGDCEKVLTSYLNDLQNRGEKLGPALFFLDQFGFSDVPMELITRIMANPVCEVFSYLDWGHMNRFLTDKTKWSSITTAFGGTEWQGVLGLEAPKRAAFMLEAYKNAIRQRTNSKYVWNFAMCDENNKLLYWLVFLTNKLRGLEVMKGAMWGVDRTGGFRFSDNENPCQLGLFTSCSDEILADEIRTKLAGQTLTVEQVKEFVLTKTPAYRFKGALKILEEADRLKIISAPYKRRKGTFPDDNLSKINLRIL